VSGPAVVLQRSATASAVAARLPEGRCSFPLPKQISARDADPEESTYGSCCNLADGRQDISHVLIGEVCKLGCMVFHVSRVISSQSAYTLGSRDSLNKSALRPMLRPCDVRPFAIGPTSMKASMVAVSSSLKLCQRLSMHGVPHRHTHHGISPGCVSCAVAHL
jgi:hypothetical protein